MFKRVLFSLAVVISGTAAAAPPGGVRHVDAYATGGSGTVGSPWTGWEKVFVGITSAGADIEFRTGYYKQHTAILAPPDLTSWLNVRGSGATIALTAGMPRFMSVNFMANDQTGRRISIEDLNIDATEARGRNAVVFGNFIDDNGATTGGGDGVHGFLRINWDSLVFKRIKVTNLLVDQTIVARTGNHLGGFHISTVQGVDNFATTNTIKNIFFEDIRIEGGNWGILVDGAGAYSHAGILANVDIDNVWLIRCWHSLMTRPTISFPSSNFQVGECGRVRHVYVIDCYGRYSGDSGLELNNVEDALVRGTVIEDAMIANFYYTNYTRTRKPPRIVYDNCIARLTSASPFPTEAGIGYYFPAGSAGATPPGGHITISNSKYLRTAAAPRQVTAAALMMTGVQSTLSLENVDFAWEGANLATVPTAGVYLVKLLPTDDFTLRVRNAKLTVTGTRSSGTTGARLLFAQPQTSHKTLTLDVSGVSGRMDITGGDQDFTLSGMDFEGTASNKIRGFVVDSSFSAPAGDLLARGLNVNFENATNDASLRISGIDGSKLPSTGSAVFLGGAHSKRNLRESQERP